jgi:hypothetical protein
MRTIYRFLILLLVILAVAFVGVKFNSFSVKNKFSEFEQKSKTKRINPANYKQYEFKPSDSLTQCTEKLILLRRCERAKYSREMHDFMYKNSFQAFKKFPNFPPIAANYAFYQQLAEGDVVKSLPIVLPFIQESANYPAIPEAIYKILNDAYHCETFEEDMVTFLGDNNYEAGREKLELLCNYWYSKLDSKYTGCSPSSLRYARKQMTGQKHQEAIAVWKKLLDYIKKSQPN